MSLLEQQNFLARIFTDGNLRHSFREYPEIIGKEYNLDESEILQLKDIVSEDLNFFAESLFHKRLHEVEKFLPVTKKILGNKFSQIFREFSQIFQPSSVKKHLEDAIEFCKYLQQFQELPTKNAAKFEQTKHEFFSQQKSLAVCLLSYDVFGQKKRFLLSVWYRIGNKVRHFIL